MIIELVSFRHELDPQKKLEYFVKIVNKSKSDILLFPGWTIEKITQLDKIDITNKKTLVVFEISTLKSKKDDNRIYLIKKGKIKDTKGFQIFSTSSELSEKSKLLDTFIAHLKKNRLTSHQGKSILHLQCGEINILKSNKSKDNKIDVRHYNHSQKSELTKIFNSVDVILNPLHTGMTNQGNLKEKRKFFSKKHKIYCFTANLTSKGSIDEKKFKKSKMIQSCFYDEKEIEGSILEVNNDMIIKEYVIKKNPHNKVHTSC